MRLTITNPEIANTLVNFPGGLLPVRRGSDSRMVLVVKASRRTAHAAKLRGGIRCYLVPTDVGGVATYGLLTAFFDDRDEPLIIRTPLFDEEITGDLLHLLSSESFAVHFFDERDRELLGFRAENPDAHRFRVRAKTLRFVSPTLERARDFLDEMQFWFGVRSTSDDAAAFTIDLRERLFTDNLAEDADNPGVLNESDIAAALYRAFGTKQVFTNPIRADNGREFVDVLVATDKTLLLIQAKDSPSTESALTRNIDRKRTTAVKHIRKAAGQLRGSINSAQSGEPLEINTNGRRCSVSLSGRAVFGLVIVQELFDPDRPACSPFVLTLFEKTGIPCLLLDQAEFQQMVFFRPTEESVVGTLQEIFLAARAHGLFPRNRFGLRTDKTTVYRPRGTDRTPDTAVHETVQPSVREGRLNGVQPAGGLATCGVSGVDYLGTVRQDLLRVVVSRAEVEALDVSRAMAILSRVLADRETVERYRGRLELVFSGYASDARELYSIPEVRAFCAKLDDAFPFWFYFVSTNGVTLGVIACCLCSVTELRPGKVSIGPDVLPFMTRHFDALNWLFETYSLDERQNVEINGSVVEYFRTGLGQID